MYIRRGSIIAKDESQWINILWDNVTQNLLKCFHPISIIGLTLPDYFFKIVVMFMITAIDMKGIFSCFT